MIVNPDIEKGRLKSAGSNVLVGKGAAFERRRWPRASSLIKKETNEHRTSNVQHRIRNSVKLKNY
jgi:hypothetical protein